MRQFEELTEVNEHGYIGYKFTDSKRFASAKVKEDSKGKYFVSNKVKYYIDSPKQEDNISKARAKWEALDKHRSGMMPSLILATEKEIIELLGFDPTVQGGVTS